MFVRRKPGTLLPLEIAICEAASVLAQRGTDEFHGYAIAKVVKTAFNARLLTAYGTLYRALGRLEAMGVLESRWEDGAEAAQERRPARRLYRLTTPGEQALARVRRGERALDLATRSGDGLAPV